ncbi:MAG: hypothetical protein QXL82_02935 [Candidatus Aenigmatarchaeota archaeon]
MRGISTFVATIILVVITVGVGVTLYTMIKPLAETPLIRVERSTYKLVSLELPNLEVINIYQIPLKDKIAYNITLLNNGGKSLTNIYINCYDSKGLVKPLIGLDSLDAGYIAYLTAYSNSSCIKFLITTAEGIKKEISWENRIPIEVKDLGGVYRDYQGVEIEVSFPAGVDKNKVRVIDANGNEVPAFIEWLVNKTENPITSEGEKAIVYFEASDIPANGSKIYYIEYNVRPSTLVLEYPKVSIVYPDTCEWWWCERRLKEGLQIENSKVAFTIALNVTNFQPFHGYDWRQGWQLNINGRKSTIYTFHFVWDPQFYPAGELQEAFIRFHTWNLKPGDRMTITKISVDNQPAYTWTPNEVLGYGIKDWSDYYYITDYLKSIKSPKVINVTLEVSPDSWLTNNLHVAIILRWNQPWGGILNMRDKFTGNPDDYRFGEVHRVYLYDNYKEKLGYPMPEMWHWYFAPYSRENTQIVSDKNVIIIKAKAPYLWSGWFWFDPYIHDVRAKEGWVMDTVINGSASQTYTSNIPNVISTNLSMAMINFHIRGTLGDRVKFESFRVGDYYYNLPELRWGDDDWGCDNCIRYYRYKFSANTFPPGVTITEARLYVASDDGVVCYLNGNKIGLDTGCLGRTYWKNVWNVDPSWFNLNGENVLACAVKERGGFEAFDAELIIYNGTGFPELPFRVVPRNSETGILNSGWKYYQQTDCSDSCNPENITPCTPPTDANGNPWYALNFDDSNWQTPPYRERWWPWWDWGCWSCWFDIRPSIFNKSGSIPIEIKVSKDSRMDRFRIYYWQLVKRAFPAEIETTYILWPNTDYIKVKMKLTNKGDRPLEIQHLNNYITQWARWDGRVVLDGFGESMHGWVWSASYIQINGSKQQVYYVNISDTFNTEEIPGGCGDRDWPRLEFRIRNMGTGTVTITDLYIGGKRWDQFPREGNFNLPITLNPGAWSPWILIKSAVCRKSGDIPIIINVSADSLSLGNGLFIRLWWWDGWWTSNLADSEFKKPPEPWIASWSQPWEDLSWCARYCNQTFWLVGVGNRSDYDWFQARGDRAHEYWISKRFRGPDAIKPGESVTMEWYEGISLNYGWDALRYGLPHPAEIARLRYIQLNTLKTSVGQTYYYGE